MKYLVHHFRVLRLFVFAYLIAAGAANKEPDIKNNRKYFLSRVKTKNYVLMDGRNCYDQPINNLIKQYDEVSKVSTGQGNDYTLQDVYWIMF